MVQSWISYPISYPSERQIVNQYYFAYRYWDGIDKPDYWRFCAIEENERDLKSGRFENFEAWVEYFDSNLQWFLIPYNQISEMMEWIFENVQGKWAMGIEQSMSEGFLMNFKFEEEVALAFKLTFSHQYFG